MGAAGQHIFSVGLLGTVQGKSTLDRIAEGLIKYYVSVKNVQFCRYIGWHRNDEPNLVMIELSVLERMPQMVVKIGSERTCKLYQKSLCTV